MKDSLQRVAAKEFAEYWKGKGYEKGESQPFWLSLLRNVFGVEKPEQYISFENKVQLSHTSFIDGYIDETKVLIEQKSLDKDLTKPILQSDGTRLKPIDQAKRYMLDLPVTKHPKWIVICNFGEFHIYNMETPHAEPEIIKLEEFEKEYSRLGFLVDTKDENIKKEMEVSIQAGNLVGVLYDEILKQYKNPDDPDSLKSLNMLCVRLVFCLYAEDAGIFGGHSKFHNYLKSFSAKDMRRALIDLFKVLDTLPKDRDPYMDEQLNAFPYVNGGLFADENIEIPLFTDEIANILLEKASEDFNWSEISPTIFGAVFESTLNPETRRSGGMHYTSIPNIHKVIDPLFLDDLKNELVEICSVMVDKTRIDKLEQFRTKLASLTFLDPACGSGNFLTETYISLRRLENEALKAIIAAQKGQVEGQIILGAGSTIVDPIKVSIGQFYGIEINDFAVTVAKTALWIAESQMMKETEDVVHMNLDFLPLKSYANIVEDNALRIDWETVVPKEKLNYIMGNPPFVGARLMDKAQKSDMDFVFGKFKGVGNLDYVTAWYRKAASMMNNETIKAAFVSTNSISQGEQPALLWSALSDYNMKIDFAHRTFKWSSEAFEKAAVHCVIIGFSDNKVKTHKLLFVAENSFQKVSNINAYLLDAPNVLINNRNTPICNVPKMDFGSMPNDGGFLSDYSYEDMIAIVSKYPIAQQLFKKLLGAQEFINNKERWCLWLEDISPSVYNSIPPVYEAIKNVYKLRSESKREATRKLADCPMLFGEVRQPKTNYLLVPSTSSENRKYVPIGFISPDIISSNANLLLPDATLYHFGVLTSNVHMAWMKAVCGRLEMRYRYSINIVYNNFPWPNPTEEQRKKIEQTAQAILDARAKYPESSLADLYKEPGMPKELRVAHQENDRAVMRAYGFGKEQNSETACVAELMKMYQELTK